MKMKFRVANLHHQVVAGVDSIGVKLVPVDAVDSGNDIQLYVRAPAENVRHKPETFLIDDKTNLPSKRMIAKDTLVHGVKHSAGGADVDFEEGAIVEVSFAVVGK